MISSKQQTKSKKSKSKSKSRGRSTKLSGAAASILELSPVKEQAEEEYEQGDCYYDDSVNYGGDCNLRRGLNEADWDHTTTANNDNRILYSQHQYQQQQQIAGRGHEIGGVVTSYHTTFNDHDQPYKEGNGSGGVDASFDSTSGVLLGNERTNHNQQQQQQQEQMTLRDYQQQGNQNQHPGSTTTRSTSSTTPGRIKARSGDSINVPLPFDPRLQYLQHNQPPPPMPLSHCTTNQGIGGVGCNSFSNDGGYNIANDSSVGYATTTTTNTTNTNMTNNSSAASSSSSSSGNLLPLPLPGFEEADLLQRAIERRALLHNRIVAMEAAKAELEIMDHYDNSNTNDTTGRNTSSGSSSSSSRQEQYSYQGGQDEDYHHHHKESRTPSKTPPRSGKKHGREHPSASKRSLSKKHSNKDQQQQQSTLSAKGYTSTSMRHGPPPPSSKKGGSTKQQHNHHSSLDNTTPTSLPFDEQNKDNDDGDDDNIDEYDSSSGSNSDALLSSSPKQQQQQPGRIRMGEHHRRMNEISDRIKKEALEFMNYESSYADAEEEEEQRHQQQRIMVDNGHESGGASGSSGEVAAVDHVTVAKQHEEQFCQEISSENNDHDEDNLNNSDHAPQQTVHPDQGEESQDYFRSTTTTAQQNESYSSSSSSTSPPMIDSSAWGDGKPTTQQLSRYSNMVRLGIPDVAVFRSMERDGVSDTRSILETLKEEHHGVQPSSMSLSSSSGSPSTLALSGTSSSIVRHQPPPPPPPTTTGSSSNNTTPQNSTGGNDSSSTAAENDRGGDNNESEGGERRLPSLPLSEDSNYSKYFKMMKAKVPRSWVRRVLEVDGKDARILDLDPNVPLSDQVGSGAVDDDGNVDWDNIAVTVKRMPSSASSSGDGSVVEEEEEDDAITKEVTTAAYIPADTFASVKAELAAMTAKAGELTIGLIPVAPSDELSAGSGGSSDRGPSSRQATTATKAQQRTISAVDSITSAAVAASNERMNRLRALRSGGGTGVGGAGSKDIGRRRQTVDEIRRRAPPPRPTAESSSNRRTFPQPQTSTSSQSSNQRQGSGGGSVTKQSYDDIPLKDDPRFAKYFQMIRSRVPRSWVERVIEVDDRDPAILDLDPNKSLASQIGEEGVEEMEKGDNDTVDSTYASLDTSRVTEQTQSVVNESDKDRSVDSQPGGEVAANELDKILPPTHIDNDDNDTIESVASSITREAEEKPSFDLAKISSYLDRLDNQVNGKDADGEDSAPDNKGTPHRFSTMEEVEDRLAKLLDNIGTTQSKESPEKDEIPDESNQLSEESQANIAKLSSMLVSRIGQSDVDVDKTPIQQNRQQVAFKPTEHTDLENLPTLLSQVLDKMDQPPDANEEAAEEKEDSEISPDTPRTSRNKALEAMFAKRAALSEVEEAKPKNLGDDPEYAKYFKMLKLGLPRASVIQALERDRKDVTIIDLDPNLPLEEQKKKSEVPDKNAALKALFSKRATETEEQKSDPTPDKNTALKALFAKRAAENEPKQQEGSAPALKVDQEYQKYMKMLKIGMPKVTVRTALERDGKDPSVADMDPEQSYASQAKEKQLDDKKKSGNGPPLQEDPEFKKFFKMLKMGIPIGAVRQALQKEGKDPDIVDLDPEKSYVSQAKPKVEEGLPLKDDPEYTKFFKMLKMGIREGAVRQALQKEGKDPNIVEMDPTKSYASQVNSGGDEKDDGPPLKDDPEYTKFFKMLKMGIPIGAVQNALKKEGKDIEIVNMDPEKSYKSQVKGNGENAGPPLKDDPEYTKFFNMLKMGIPMGAVQNALKKEGKDVNIINMDPEKPLSAQQSKPKEAKKPVKPKAPKVARKRLHWNKIDESKLHEKSFWNQAKGEPSLQLKGLDIDNEEFTSLFTASVNKSAAQKKDPAADTKKPAKNQKVQLIDGRRRMNGSILLTKFKVDYKVLAKQVDAMEYIEAEGNELRGMLQLLPTKDEALALRSYLPPPDAPLEEYEESLHKLGECEQYMAVMLDIPDVKAKFEAMLVRADFEGHTESIRDGTKLLIKACDVVRNSERFQKVLLYALKLGNALNTGGSNEVVSAITLDSLLKLAEAKAFDRQTSVLHYLVSIVQQNDVDVLKLSEDFEPVKAAERVAMEMLAQTLRELEKGIQGVKDVVKRNLPETQNTSDMADDEKEDEVLGSTPMGKFSVSASAMIQSLSNEFNDAKASFVDLLQFFGEDTSMNPEAFFCTINTFVSMFDQTHKELVRKEEAKARRTRIDEKKKLREQEMASKKLKSGT